MSEVVKIRKMQPAINSDSGYNLLPIFMEFLSYLTTNNRVTRRPSNHQSNADEDVEKTLIVP